MILTRVCVSILKSEMRKGRNERRVKIRRDEMSEVQNLHDNLPEVFV